MYTEDISNITLFDLLQQRKWLPTSMGKKKTSPIFWLEGLSPPRKQIRENSLVVQRLRLCAFTAVGQGSIPGQGTMVPQAMLYCQKERKEGGRKERKEEKAGQTEKQNLEDWLLYKCLHHMKCLRGYLSDQGGLLSGLITYPTVLTLLQMNIPETPSGTMDNSLQSLGWLPLKESIGQISHCGKYQEPVWTG